MIPMPSSKAPTCRVRRMRVESLDTTPSQRAFVAALILQLEGPHTTRQLAHRLGLTPNATWKMLNKLCASHEYALTCVDGQWTLQ